MLIFGGICFAQQRIDLNIRYREYRIRVDLKPRILTIQEDGEYLYMRYFANSAFEPRMQFLGEEIYTEGKKISDTFKEND
jgi:hypothetical protein